MDTSIKMVFGDHGFPEMELSLLNTEPEQKLECYRDNCFNKVVFYSIKKNLYYCIHHLFLDQIEYNKYHNLKSERPKFWKKKKVLKELEALSIPRSKL